MSTPETIQAQILALVRDYYEAKFARKKSEGQSPILPSNATDAIDAMNAMNALTSGD